MQFKQMMVPASQVFDAHSGVCLADTNQTIASHLTNAELKRYARAMLKMGDGSALNRKDLVVLDKIDAITYENHGMCLKDSLVTKARLKACKKYGVQFIDRDNLVDHMNSMLPVNDVQAAQSDLSMTLAELFIERFENDLPEKIWKIVTKLACGEDFDLEDLQFISEMETLAYSETGLSIIDEQIRLAIDKSCKKLGIYFKNLQKVVVH